MRPPVPVLEMSLMLPQAAGAVAAACAFGSKKGSFTACFTGHPCWSTAQKRMTTATQERHMVKCTGAFQNALGRS